MLTRRTKYLSASYCSCTHCPFKAYTHPRSVRSAYDHARRTGHTVKAHEYYVITYRAPFPEVPHVTAL
jgi:hypothetical protein